MLQYSNKRLLVPKIQESFERHRRSGLRGKVVPTSLILSPPPVKEAGVKACRHRCKMVRRLPWEWTVLNAQPLSDSATITDCRNKLTT